MVAGRHGGRPDVRPRSRGLRASPTVGSAPGRGTAFAGAVGRPGGRTRPPAAAPAPAPAPVAGRIVSDATPASAPVVQASRAGGPIAAFAATPIVQRVDGAAPVAEGSGGGGRSDSELDDLARQLFGRIRTHLRNEVIHEREAKGLGFDAF